MKILGLSTMALFTLTFCTTASHADVRFFNCTGALVSKSTGIAFETGTITCAQGHTVMIFGELIQTKGQKLTVSSAFHDITCTGANMSWTVANENTIGPPISQGPAQLICAAFDTTDNSETPTNIVKVQVRQIP